MAFVFVVEKWKPYMLGHKFIIRTYHQSLKHLMEQRILTPLQQKLITKLLPYDYEEQYKRGRENTAADALSRLSEGHITLQAVFTVTSPLIQEIRDSVTYEPYLQKLIQEKTEDTTKHPLYTLTNQGLQHKGKWVVGNNAYLRVRIIREIQNGSTGGHSGRDATRKRISRSAIGKAKPRISTSISRHVTCVNDHSAYPGLLQPLPIPGHVWTSIFMDFIESLPKSEGKEAILIVVDRLSKYAHFLALSHPYTAPLVARAFMDHVYKRHGMPTDIVRDRGSVFLSSFWQELMKNMKVQMKLSTSYHPQTDSQTEVVNRSVEGYLRCMTGDFPRQWVQWLPLAEWWYNTSHHSAINTSPYEALYGQPPATHLPYLAGTCSVEAMDRSLSARLRIIQDLKDPLQKAQ